MKTEELYVRPDLVVTPFELEGRIMEVSAKYGEEGAAGAKPEIVFYGGF